MSIVLKEVKSKKELKEFIHLPAKLHVNESNWVPPVYMDEWIYFNPAKNKSFTYADTILLIAFRENKAVGRIMGIINHRYNEIRNEKHGRFCFLEGYEDSEVATALLQATEKWAQEKGMVKLIGPFGFSDKDPQGFLIEGFEHLPVIATNYNSPAAIEFIEKSGYTKEVDLFVYKVYIPKELPEFYKRILERIDKSTEYNIIEFNKRRVVRKYIRPIFSLINETFKEIYGFMPFEQKEMDEFAKRYLAVINPEFVKVIEKDGECIAFIIGMPDISEGIIKAKGYVFPFGFIHILRSQKKTDRLVLLLGGIKEEYRGKGLNVILGTKIIESAWRNGFEYIDSHLELEENTKMRAEMEKMGGVPYKKYRVFQKSI